MTFTELQAYVGRVRDEICKGTDVNSAHLFDSSRKSRKVVPPRERAILRLRTGVMQRCLHGHSKRRRYESEFAIRGRFTPRGWAPLSFPHLAKLTGFNHTTFVLMMERIEKRLAVKAELEEFSRRLDRLEAAVSRRKPP